MVTLSIAAYQSKSWVAKFREFACARLEIILTLAMTTGKKIN
jgi:hypothetical protein